LVRSQVLYPAELQPQRRTGSIYEIGNPEQTLLLQKKKLRLLRTAFWLIEIVPCFVDLLAQFFAFLRAQLRRSSTGILLGWRTAIVIALPALFARGGIGARLSWPALLRFGSGRAKHECEHAQAKRAIQWIHQSEAGCAAVCSAIGVSVRLFFCAPG
jgi:hypothetical protein